MSKLNFHDLMPGYRVFRVRDKDDQVRMMDTGELADALTAMAKIYPDTMEKVHETMTRARHQDIYNELLTDLTEVVIARESGIDGLFRIVKKRAGSDDKTDAAQAAKNAMKLSRTLCDKLSNFNVSHHSSIGFLNKDTGETRMYGIKRVVGGLIVGTYKQSAESIAAFTKAIESAQNAEGLLEVIAKASVASLSDIEEFDESIFDKVT